MVTGLGFAFSDNNGSLPSRFSRLLARQLYRAATHRNRRVIFQNPDDRADFIAQGCLASTSNQPWSMGLALTSATIDVHPLLKRPFF